MGRNCSPVIAFSILLLMLCVGQGCNSAKRSSQSAETDALFRAVRTGSPDTVKALLNSPNVDVNAVDEHAFSVGSGRFL